MNNGEYETPETAELTKEDIPSSQQANREFIDNLKSVNSSYLAIVIISAAIAAAGITVAVLWYVSAGLALAILAILFYMYATKSLLSGRLGISYKSSTGRLCISKLCTNGKQELWIPSRLLWLDVTEISNRVFTPEDAASVKILHLPKALLSIGKYAFEDCNALQHIYFEGSEQEWASIELNCDLEGIELHFLDNSIFSVPKTEKKSKHSSKQPTADINDIQNISAKNTEDKNNGK